MVIMINTIPRFYLKLTNELVQLCVQCSELHYDAACRRSGAAGGFLFGWRNITTPFEGSDPESATCSASLGDLDVLLKVMEVTSAAELAGIFTPSQSNSLRQLDKAIRVAIRKSERWIRHVDAVVIHDGL